LAHPEEVLLSYVYLVKESIDYMQDEILGVFATYVLAKAYVENPPCFKTSTAVLGENIFIEEWELKTK